MSFTTFVITFRLSNKRQVQSREAPFIRSEPVGDSPFGYNVGDARLYHASRAPTYHASPSPHATAYASDLLSTTGHHMGHGSTTDITGISSYRGSTHGGGYSYVPVKPAYYTAAYSSSPHGLTYGVHSDVDNFGGYGLPVPTGEAHHDAPSGIPVMSMPGAPAWPSSRSMKSPSGYGSMYLDPEVTASPTTYTTPPPSAYSAVRGHSAAGDGPNFSFTNMSASLPSSQSDRVLPVPSSTAATTTTTSHRSSTYSPLSGANKPPTATDSSYDSYGSSRTESSGPESIFSDSERAAAFSNSQGPAAFDMSPYGTSSGSTDASGRRDSAYAAAGAGHETGGGHDGPSLPSLSSAYERHHAAVATRH